MSITKGNALTKGLSGGSLTVVGPTSRANRDPFAPNYELLIHGGVGAKPYAITDEVKAFIDTIKFEDNADQFDTLTINITSQSDDLGGGDINSLLDSKVFAEGHIVEVRMGYGKELITIGAAIIVKIEPDYPDGEAPTITITGYDLLFKASRNNHRKGVGYKDFRDSQIASIIGSRNGFDIKSNKPNTFENIRRTKGKHNRTQKKGVNDYKFLKKVADINGFDLYSRFDATRGKFVLFFEPPPLKNNKEVFTFFYGLGDIDYQFILKSFKPKLDAQYQGTEFEIFIGINSKLTFKPIDRLDAGSQQRLKTLENSRYTGGAPGNGKPANDDGIEVAFKAFGRSFKFPKFKRFKNEDDARRSIEQFIKRQKENFITGEGSFIGFEAIQSRQIQKFEGMAKQYNGKYFLTKVIHTMSKGDGYSTEFSCRKVIEDVLLQAPPTFALTDNDKRFKKSKGL